MTREAAAAPAMVNDGHCFACGPNSDIGLHLHFRIVGDRAVRAETTLARETTALAALDAQLSDPELYAKPTAERARLTARHAQLADRLAKAEAAWLAAAEAYETSAGD